MIQGVAQVIRNHFFNLKLISPDNSRLRPPVENLRLLLLSQEGNRLDLVADHGDKIKSLHYYLLISGFQLIQSQKLPNQIIHLGGLVHDYVAVELPALFIIVDALLESLRIALDQGDGGF